MSDIQSVSIPGVYTDVQSVAGGVSIAGGTRIGCIIGEGLAQQTLVSAARGGGLDGLGPLYTTSNPDSRHFQLAQFPLVSNRVQVFKNGVPLQVLEEEPDTDPFSNKYGARVGITTGHLELQSAYLVDQGGKLYKTGVNNVGVGTLGDGYALTLLDVNAISETFSIKCVSCQFTAMGAVVPETAKFIAVGSKSGVQVDSTGNPVVWKSDGSLSVSSIFSFSIEETLTSFRPGDFFTIQVASGALAKNDTLSCSYLPVANLNDPEFFTNLPAITAKHGAVSTENTISLGAQLAFANSPPGVMTLQARPALPRRTSYILNTDVNANSTDVDDFSFPLPLGVSPDDDSNIHFFVLDPTTKVETQLLPNKFPFFTLDTSGNPSTSSFIFSDADPPAGHSFSYSVNQGYAALNFGNDGYLNRDLGAQLSGTFSVSGTTFTADYVNKIVHVFDSTNLTNNTDLIVTNVVDGNLIVTAIAFSAFVNNTAVHFHVINPVTGDTVASSTGTDGVLTVSTPTSHAVFASSAVNFTGLSTLLGLKLVITTATTSTNLGTFDILSVDGSDNITIAKSLISEDNLNYEVQDPTSTSDYIIVNHNVVPNGNQLRVTIVDSRDADFFDAGWEEALSVLETVEVDILVPLPTQTKSVIFQNFLNHCETMSNIRNKKERLLFTGAIAGLTPDNLTGAEPAAVEDIGVLEGIQGDNISEILAGNTEDLTNYSVPDAFGHSFRAMYFYPDQIVVSVNGDNTLLDGFYLAAAAAGYVSGTANITMPLTAKVLSGFTILRNKTLSTTVQEQLVAAGVCLLQPVAGGGNVIWGKTTTQSGSPEEEEMSVIFIRDRIAKSLRSGFAGFIGTPAEGDAVSILTTRANKLFQAFGGAQKMITSYSSLLVSQDSVDPRQFNISANCVPVNALNWIYIKVGIGSG